MEQRPCATRAAFLAALILLQTTTAFTPTSTSGITRQFQSQSPSFSTSLWTTNSNSLRNSNGIPEPPSTTKRRKFANFLQGSFEFKSREQETPATNTKWSSRRPDIESGRRYRSKDWFINIMSLPKSFVLRRIKFHLISNTLLTTLVVLIDKLWFPLSIPTMAHTMLGSFLGLLLVFRTDSAYSRFWQARGNWCRAKEACRNLAIVASTQLKYHSPKAATRILELLLAFPDALAYTCLSGSIPLGNRLKRLVPERMQTDPAVSLCLMMQHQLLAATQESPSAGLSIVEARYHNEASQFIQALMDATTSCEIIVRTPVPWSYSRHTSRFLTMWCGTLPFAFVPLFGWLTIPVVMVVCWCLFGIEEIGHLIEQPFVSDDIVSQGYLSPADRLQLKTKAYDIGIPVEQLAWMISGQVVEIAHSASQLPDIDEAEEEDHYDAATSIGLDTQYVTDMLEGNSRNATQTNS